MAAEDPISGVRTTGNQTIGVRVDMDEAIDILTPSDVPVQQLLGTDTTALTRIDWLSDQLTPQTFTWTSKTGTGPWTVTSPDTSYIRVGDVYAIQNGTDSAVQFLVDSITSATVVVVSGFAGNTTSAADGSVLELIGQFRNEGSEPLDQRAIERGEGYNITSIDQEEVKATRTARHRGARGGLYGAGDPLEDEKMKKFKELGIRFDRQLLHGQRSSSGLKRSMGGLFYFITAANGATATSGVKANLKTLLDSAIQGGYEKGGSGNYILMVSPAVKTLIDNLSESAVRTTRTDTGRGIVVDTYKSSFGEVSVVPNRHLPKTRGLVLQPEYDTIVNFDPYFYEDLAKTGDFTRGQIVAEKTLRVKNPEAQGTFTVTDA